MNRIRVSFFTAVLTLPLLAQSTFNGKWEFNPSMSKNVGMMMQMKLTSTIVQSSDDITITNASVFNGSEQTTETHLDVSGKSVSNKDPMGSTAETVTQLDSGKLVTTWITPGSVAGTKSTRKEIRSLSRDGRIMTVESKRGSAPPMIMVYERK